MNANDYAKQQLQGIGVQGVTELTRQQQLAQTFQRFAQIDAALIDTRQRLAEAQKNREELEISWEKASQELTTLMVAEAPKNVLENIKQYEALRGADTRETSGIQAKGWRG